MIPFHFFTDIPSCDSSNVFCVHIDPEITTPKDLITSFYYSLWFPGYFGFNWDALYDCLRDLEWIPYRKIAIIHRTIPKIPENELKLYLSVLMDASLFFKEKKDYDLYIFFREQDRVMINSLLKNR